MTASDSPVVDPVEENVLDELVDLLNAQDFEAVAEFLHADVSSDLFDAAGRQGALEGFESLHHRYPGLVYTRGELGTEPVVVAWTMAEDRTYRQMGFLTFTFRDDREATDGAIEHIDYDDSPADQMELLAEEPDIDDAAEGAEWREWEYGES